MKKTVYVLATGGTISGAGAPGQAALYSTGALSAEDLLRGMPALPDGLAVIGEQFCDLSSEDLTEAHWIGLARRINALAEEPDVCGFVITHGTNTMEETAFFLNLTVKTEKPVVLTGSMRPATSLSADGPMNLYQSLCLAASPEAAGLGVLVCFSDAVYDARNVRKISACRPQAFSSGDLGCVGFMRDHRPFIRFRPATVHTVGSRFSADRLTELPCVDVVHVYAGADPDVFVQSSSKCSGVVLSGAGSGCVPGSWKAAIKGCVRAGKPVVRSSRTNGGVVVWDDFDDACGTLPGYDLTAEKLRILLALCIAEKLEKEELHRVLRTY